MTSEEIKQMITPNILNFGVVANGTKMPFVLNNTSSIPIEGHSLSCGCVGQVKSSEWKVEGEIEAQFKPDKAQSLFLVDGRYCLQIDQSSTIKYLLVQEKQFVDNPTSIEEVTASKFDQQIYLRFDDGDAVEIRQDNGEFVTNANKLKVNIPVTFWVLK